MDRALAASAGRPAITLTPLKKDQPTLRLPPFALLTWSMWTRIVEMGCRITSRHSLAHQAHLPVSRGIFLSRTLK